MLPEKLASVIPPTGADSSKSNSSTSNCLKSNSYPESLEAFFQENYKECVEGSAIDPTLYKTVIEVRASLEISTGNEPIAPIHEALNWHYVRFGAKAQETLFGAIFRNEDGSVWQAKLSRSLQIGKKPYFAPSGNGSRAFLPAVTVKIWYEIAKRCKLVAKLPKWVRTAHKRRHHNIKSGSPSLMVTTGEASFWGWIKAHPEIPLIITEGGKKSLSALSHGSVAIALYGVNAGYSINDKTSGVRKLKPELIPDLLPFTTPGREIILAFDQDAESKTVAKVNQALTQFGKLLVQAGCEVSISVWDRENGLCKGVDDLIVNRGVEAWKSALEGAVSFDEWQRKRYTQELWKLSYKPALMLNQRYLGEIPFPQSGLACVRSPKGTGKTQSLAPFIREASAIGRKTLVITHRIQLGRAICEDIGIEWIEDVRKTDVGSLLGFGLCIDSLHENSQAAFDADDWDGAIVILDEVEQVIWHLLNSSTCKAERIKIIATLRQLLRNVIATGGLIIAQDADLSDASINFLRGDLIGENALYPWLVVNEWQDPSTAWNVHLFETKLPSEALLQADLLIDAGKKIFIACDAQKAKSTWGSKNLEKYLSGKHPGKKILRIDSETVSDPDCPGYGSIEKINEVVQSYDIVIATPTIGTGVSIDVQGHFSAVFGIFQGAIPESEARQALGRVRENIPRYVWAKSMGLGSIGNGSQFAGELVRSTQRAAMANLQILKDADLLDLDLDDPESMTDAVCFRTWAKMAARINSGMPEYRKTLAESLKAEGHNVIEAGAFDEDEVEELKAEVKEIRIESQTDEALAVAEAEPIDDKQYEALRNKRAKVESERLQQRKHELQKLYGIEATADLHIKHENGFYSKIRLHYLLTQHDSKLAEQADSSEIDTSLINGDGKTLHLPDLTPRTARVKLLIALGIPALIDPSRGKIRATDEDVQVLVEKLKTYRRAIKDVLGLSFSDKFLEKPMQALQLLLDKIGFKAQSKRVRTESGLERVYLVPTPQDERWEIFKAWNEKRDSVSSSDTVCSNPGYINKQKTEGWNKTGFTQEDIADAREMWLSAPDGDARELLKASFPPDLLAAAIAA